MITKPQPEEYNPYYVTYIAKVPDGDVIELLKQLKESSYELFSKLSNEQANHAYAEGKWTLKEALGHMIDTERVFAFRAFCFSREYSELPGFDQEVYINNSNFNDRSIQDLASEFRVTRESNLYLFRSLTEEQLNRKGIASGNPATVRALVYMVAGHELHHLGIIKERYLG
ncbi:MAG TPA: DinB family protein [Mucilaginibacter sp.]|nr:DinB family protein [Mucilaginibacter sp.]